MICTRDIHESGKYLKDINRDISIEITQSLKTSKVNVPKMLYEKYIRKISRQITSA